MTAAVNVFFGHTRPGGRLEPLRFDVPEEEMRFGAGTVPELTWKQTMDTFSCTECGRCQDVCPAFNTGKELSPKLLIMALRDQVFAEGPKLLRGEEGFEPEPLVPGAVTDDVVWDCVTCGACVQECPVSIEHVDHIIDLRRHLVMVDSRFPAEAEPMLRDVERASNPWGKPQTERADWAERLGVRVIEPGDPPPDLLYWVGCAASFDERARTAAESTAKLLAAAGIDFGILGPREACTGDPARRMGNEYLFQSYAERNVKTLNDAGVTKVVASCPHCFNTIGNEYPDFGGDYEVIHHTELLAELVREGRLQPNAGEGSITYHDSCYLARHNDVLSDPRELVAAVGEPIEMERSGKRTFCCGAGGAHMWMEERAGKINEERVREAAETGAETLAVACPFCTVMLDDGVRQRGDELRVVDVSTLLAEAIEPVAGRWPRPPACQNCRSAALYRDGCFPCKAEVPLLVLSATPKPGGIQGGGSVRMHLQPHRLSIAHSPDVTAVELRVDATCPTGGGLVVHGHDGFTGGDQLLELEAEIRQLSSQPRKFDLLLRHHLLLKPGGFEGFATRHFAQGVERLLAPAAEVAPAPGHVEEAIAKAPGLHPHLQLDERAALSRSEEPVGIGAGQLATHPDLPQITRPLDQEARLHAPGRVARHLDVLVALLKALPLDLDHARPPFRVAVGSADEAPHLLDRSVQVRLLAMGGHCLLPTPRGVERLVGIGVGAA